MKLFKINKEIKCDTVLCNCNAKYEFISNSYKGNIYLCEDCFNSMQNIMKKVNKNETKSN